MSEFRYNKLRREWVLFAPTRTKRPHNYTTTNILDDVVSCPFEPGCEEFTPQEIDRIPNDSGDSWSCRVIPNLYTALSLEDTMVSKRDGYFEKKGGFGVHEVIIETPKHQLQMYNYELKEFSDYFKILKKRFDSLKNDSRLEYISFFKNSGENAGASLEHSHSQLIALPFIPKETTSDIEYFDNFYKEHGRNFFDDLIYEERSFEEDFLFENNSFVAYCPYGSKFAFEISIVAKKELSSFSDFKEDDILELSKITAHVFKKLHSTLDDFAFNLLIKNAPLKKRHSTNYRFHMQIIPRLYKIAGFELSSDIFINTMLPEDALKILKHEKKG